MARIEGITVPIEGDNTGLQRELSESAAATERFSNAASNSLGSFARVLRNTAVAAAGVTAAIAAITRSVGDQGAQFITVADATRTSVEAIQSLSRAYSRAGFGTERLRTNLFQFEKQLQQLREGVPAAVEAFDGLNLSAGDFVGLNVAEAFAATGEAAALAGANTAGFSADMQAGLEIMGNVGDVLERVREDIRSGLILPREALESAAEFNDILEDIRDVATRQIAQGFLSGFDQVLSRGNADLQDIAVTMENIGIVFGALAASGVNLLTATVSVIGEALPLIKDEVEDIADSFVNRILLGIPDAAEAAAEFIRKFNPAAGFIPGTGGTEIEPVNRERSQLAIVFDPVSAEIENLIEALGELEFVTRETLNRRADETVDSIVLDRLEEIVVNAQRIQPDVGPPAPTAPDGPTREERFQAAAEAGVRNFGNSLVDAMESGNFDNVRDAGKRLLNAIFLDIFIQEVAGNVAESLTGLFFKQEGGFIEGDYPGQARLGVAHVGELVLNVAQQANVARALLEGRGGGGDTYNFEFIQLDEEADRAAQRAIPNYIQAVQAYRREARL